MHHRNVTARWRITPSNRNNEQANAPLSTAFSGWKNSALTIVFLPSTAPWEKQRENSKHQMTFSKTKQEGELDKAKMTPELQATWDNQTKHEPFG